MPLKKITSAHVSRYREKREETGNGQNGKRISPDTVDKELALLKAVFEVAVREWKWIELNPATGVNVENTGKPRIRYLTGDEMAGLDKACKTWLKNMVMVAHFTGMRRGNLIALEWSQVDLFQRQITLHETKNDEPLAIPMCKDLYELFVSLCKVRHINSEYVFHNADGSPIKLEKLRKAFKSACKKAKIENFRWHDLRHQFASELVQKGVPLYEVQKLLGHKSIKVTEKYAHLAPSNLRNAIKAFDRKRDANFGRNMVETDSRKSSQ